MDVLQTILILSKRVRVTELCCVLLSKVTMHCFATQATISSSDLKAVVNVLLMRNHYDSCIALMEKLVDEDARCEGP
jgi:Mn2+/Fe2+ NRAMP family transporter